MRADAVHTLGTLARHALACGVAAGTRQNSALRQATHAVLTRRVIPAAVAAAALLADAAAAGTADAVDANLPLHALLPIAARLVEEPAAAVPGDGASAGVVLGALGAVPVAQIVNTTAPPACQRAARLLVVSAEPARPVL